MKAYRVENQTERHGIWRDFDGTINPVFSKLTQGKCKDMPMEDSDFYRHDGKQWFSATDTPEKLKAWFSALDVVEMQNIGYSVFEFEISSCRVVSEYEICFTRDNIISQKQIDPREIYGEEYEKALAEIKLKPCPFCGGTDLELRDYTENVYGFWDYKIRCKTCRAYMDSPSTAYITPIGNGIRQTRNDKTKAKAKRELIINWNRRATDESRKIRSV